MRKHFWMRHIDDDSDHHHHQNHHHHQGWVWGLVHVLGYHHHQWRFNIKKMIKTHKHGTHAQTGDERELLLGDEPSQATRRSIGSRIRGVFVQPRQRRRTSRFSIDDEERIRGEWKKQHPIIFVPPPLASDMDKTGGFDEGLNILEIFKVDRELLVQHLQHADQGVAKFSRAALRLDAKKLGKSRSFPAVDDDRKIKPVTIEDKQRDVWSVPREDRNVAAALMGLLPSRPSERRRSHRRCSSLNDSMDKYTRLFDRTNSQKDVGKLNSSRSFKLGNEQAQVELSFRRMQSLSKADSFRSILSFEIADEGADPSQESLVMIARDSSSSAITLHIIEDQKEGLFMDDRVAVAATAEAQQREVVADVDDDTILEHEFERDTGFVISSDEIDIHLPTEGLESEATTTNDADMEFVRQILNHRLTCFEQPPLSPKVLEESIRNHADKFLYRHQLLFDLVNEMLGDVYEASAAYYYPKPLSSSCHVRPFPTGEHAAKEVASRVESVVKLKPEEKQSIDSVLWFDQTHDNRWMNLQLETESVALGIEDLIFREIAEEMFD
ncbi:hypothetical protein M569_02671 [Genlisea aurea]|uniref:DUF4378 domain-containing protein n=1 Tax=Genlisea aurea TaxID=192259 RepID=S8CXC6_9LAMI|nr:hypothetical protein M569_02671 [Genlisea aurea]